MAKAKIDIKSKDLVQAILQNKNIEYEDWINEKHKEFIFDRFNQVIDSNNEVKGGSGLGLTITKQIIELHKGKIYVESEVGKGSKFVIELPSNN